MKVCPCRRTFLSASFACFVLSGASMLACAHSVKSSLSAGAGSSFGAMRDVEIKHESCDTDSRGAIKVDVNNDKRSEITRVIKSGREVCRSVDLNFDGRVDSYVYYDDQGKLRRRESDFDRDGAIDEIAHYKNGQIERKDRETNIDGKLDTWDFYEREQLVRRERDGNGDGKIDQWWQFPDPKKPDCPIVTNDADGDGKPDVVQDVCKEREASASGQSQPSAPSETPQGASDAGAPKSPSDIRDAGTTQGTTDAK